MKVRNVRPRRLITIQHGVVSSQITTLICKKGCKIGNGKRETRRPEELKYLIAPGANIAYDVEVFCGIKRYLEGFQREEIKKQLEDEHGIFISSRKISVLANQFVEHFKKLHTSRAQAFRKVLKSDGGTPWHVDATGEEGSGTVLIVYAGWRKWVLETRKITTESKEQIKPLLHETADQFGPPRAVVRDYGKGMIPAIEEFVQEHKEKIIILGCHTHFIKFVGKNLLTSEYNELRQLIRNYNIRADLRRIVRAWSKDLGEKISELKTKIETWIFPNQAQPLPKGNMGIATVRAMAQSTLDYLENNKNQRFPFVLPHVEFYQRCKTLYHACEFYINLSQTDKSVLKALKRLVRVLTPVILDLSFKRIDQNLSFRFKLFTELRTALRLNSDNAVKKIKPGVQESQSVARELNDIKKALREYKVSLQLRYLRGESAKDKQQAVETILKHLKEHENNLWGHVIQMPKFAAGGIKIVCRTNNCLENFNGRLKQEERKRSGRKVLTKDFEDLPEGVPLIKNLKKLDYVEVLCGSLENLPVEIAKSDHAERVKKDIKRIHIKTESEVTASLPKDDRQFIRKINIAKFIQNVVAQSDLQTYTFTS
jgi:ElaB/YqjD/DUF883 family membrane-anchored ribosome-binding protein